MLTGMDHIGNPRPGALSEFRRCVGRVGNGHEVPPYPDEVEGSDDPGTLGKGLVRLDSATAVHNATIW